MTDTPPTETASAPDVPASRLTHGPSMPRIGMGTWQLRGEECENAVLAALDVGYRHIDTAEVYENEEAVGRAIRGWDRDDLFLTSKVWREHLRPDDLKEACARSLDRLGTDRLDLYLIHWPNSDVPVDETVGALKELLREGRIGAWGASNFTVAHLEEVLDYGQPSVNQVEIHPLLTQPALDDWCQDQGVVVTAYSPLAQGELLDDPVLAGIGEHHDKTPAQVALRWSLQAGHVVIPRSSRREHLEENLDILDFELALDEMTRIDDLNRDRRLTDPGFAEFDRTL